jgi:putative hydrolase of the HAD superfamily
VSRLRAVLFDATGTLIALAEPVGETYARVARRHGVDLSAARLEDAFRRVLAAAPPLPVGPAPGVEARERQWWRERVRATFRAADQSRPLADPEAAFAQLWAHYADPAAWRPRPGAREALRALGARGWRRAVVSNFDHRLPALLGGLGLGDELEAVVLPGAAGAAKPDPRIFRCALARLRVGAGEAVYVGDDVAQDRGGARAAGLAAIDVSGLATLAELPQRLAAAQREAFA